jgi:hypothetical protein
MIGFDNGVFDLLNKCFIKDKTTDITVGYDYIDYDPEHKHVVDVKRFLERVIADKHVRTDTLKTISGFLNKNTDPDPQINIIFGDGSNGKLSFELLCQMAFGSYCYNVDPNCGVYLDDIDVVAKQTKILLGSAHFITMTNINKYHKIFSGCNVLSTCNSNKVQNIVKNKNKDKIKQIHFKSRFVDYVDDCVFYNDDQITIYPKQTQFINCLYRWRKAFMWILINEYYEPVSAKTMKRKRDDASDTGNTGNPKKTKT